ncbi:MAG: hypothetical protein HFG08_00090 [Oscillibacter sp.]|nr:hypothetical protein [Oscillibacter sp.]
MDVKISKIAGTKSESCRAVIDAYAPQSYMPVSFVPIDTAEYGKVNNKDLIFEIDYRAFLDDWQNTRREIFLPTKAV